MKQTGYKMVKVDAELHADLKLYALKNQLPLYKVVDSACRELLKKDSTKKDSTKK